MSQSDHGPNFEIQIANLNDRIRELERERDEAENRLPSEVSWLLQRVLESDWADDPEIEEICTRYKTDTQLRDRLKLAEDAVDAMEDVAEHSGDPEYDGLWSRLHAALAAYRAAKEARDAK